MKYLKHLDLYTFEGPEDYKSFSIPGIIHEKEHNTFTVHISVGSDIIEWDKSHVCYQPDGRTVLSLRGFIVDEVFNKTKLKKTIKIINK